MVHKVGPNPTARDLERMGYYEDGDGIWMKGKKPKASKLDEDASAPKIDKKNFIINIEPHAKPRMTNKDKHHPSDKAIRYFNWKAELERVAHEIGMPLDLPGQIQSIIFMVPMPKSWSKKKRNEMYSKPHQQVPDLDNFLKGFQDALCPEDSHIYSIKGELGKYWNTEGRIILKL